MSNEELYQYINAYVVDTLTFEERRSMGPEAYRKYVKEHFAPVLKSELVVGQEYNGHCRNASKATWDGEKFRYKRYKFGEWEDAVINHFEDDINPHIDVFVPVKEI